MYNSQQPSSPNATTRHHHQGIPMQVKQELHEIASKCGELSNKIDAFSTASPNTLMMEMEHLRRQNEELRRHCMNLEEMIKRSSTGSQGVAEQEKNDPGGQDSRNIIQSLEAKLAQQIKDNFAMKQRLDDYEGNTAHMTAQLITYKEDFETERRDRERAQGKIAELEIEIQQLKQQRNAPPPRSMLSVDDHQMRTMPHVYQHVAPPSHVSPSHHHHHQQQYPPQNSYNNVSNYYPNNYVVRPKNGYDVCDDIETDSKGTNPDYVVFDQRAPASNLRGRGVVEQSKYQTDDIDNEDEPDCCPAPPVNTGYTVTDSASVGTYRKTCGVVGDRSMPRPVGINHCRASPPRGNIDDSPSSSVGLRLSSVDDVSRNVRPSPPSRVPSPRDMADDMLQCPKCFKGFKIEDHHLLLEHIEEVCMH